MDSGTTTAAYDLWGMPYLIETNEYADRLELVYKQTSIVTFCNFDYMNNEPEERIFKIVFSCKKGKWNKSEPIYGKIVPKQSEHFEFE